MISVAGILSDRLGLRPILVSALLLFGVTGPALALTTDFRVALDSGSSKGIGGGAIPMSTITSVGDLYDSTPEAFAQSFHLASTSVAAAVDPFLAGVLVVLAGKYSLLLYWIAIPVDILHALRYAEPTGLDRERDVDARLRSLLGLSFRTDTLSVIVARRWLRSCSAVILTYKTSVVVWLLDSSPGVAGLLVAARASCRLDSGRPGRVGLRRPMAAHDYIMNVALAAGLAVFVYAPSIPFTVTRVLLVGTGFGFLMPVYRSIFTGIAPAHHRGRLVCLLELSPA
jgi:MFS family permease